MDADREQDQGRHCARADREVGEPGPDLWSIKTSDPCCPALRLDGARTHHDLPRRRASARILTQMHARRMLRSCVNAPHILRGVAHGPVVTAGVPLPPAARRCAPRRAERILSWRPPERAMRLPAGLRRLSCVIALVPVLLAVGSSAAVAQLTAAAPASQRMRGDQPRLDPSFKGGPLARGLAEATTDYRVAALLSGYKWSTTTITLQLLRRRHLLRPGGRRRAGERGREDQRPRHHGAVRHGAEPVAGGSGRRLRQGALRADSASCVLLDLGYAYADHPGGGSLAGDIHPHTSDHRVPGRGTASGDGARARGRRAPGRGGAGRGRPRHGHRSGPRAPRRRASRRPRRTGSAPRTSAACPGSAARRPRPSAGSVCRGGALLPGPPALRPYAIVARIAVRSASVVRGLTIANRVTVSPR